MKHKIIFLFFVLSYLCGHAQPLIQQIQANVPQKPLQTTLVNIVDTLHVAYQPKFALTTTGTSGASTFNGVTLNIPQYSGGSGLPTSIGSSFLETYPSGTVIWRPLTMSSGDSLSNWSYIPLAVYNVYTGAFGNRCYPDSSTDNSNAFRVIMDSAQNRFWKYRVNPIFVFPYVQGSKNYYGFSTLYKLYGTTPVQSLLWMPKDSNATTAYTQQEVITIQGPDMNSVSAPPSNNTQNIGVRIGVLGKMQPTMTNGQPAVIAIPEGLSNTNGFNQIKLDISGLTIVARNNTNMAGVYAAYAESMNLHNMTICVDTAQSLSPVTTAPWYNVGAYYPAPGNGAQCYMNNLCITGFHTDFTASDHFSSNQRCYIGYSDEGCRAFVSTHPIVITDILFQTTKYWVVVSKHPIINPYGAVKSPLILNIDGEQDAGLPTVKCVIDSNTVGMGTVGESLWPIADPIVNGTDSNISFIDVQQHGQLATNTISYNHDIASSVDLFVYKNNTTYNSGEWGFTVEDNSGIAGALLLLQNSPSFTTSSLLKSHQSVIASGSGNTNGLLLGTNANANFGVFTNANASSHLAFTIDGSQRSGLGGTAAVNANSWLNISAGTTSIAPLTFTSGTNLTTATVGAEEYDGHNLWFTPVGTQRYGVNMTVFTSTADNLDSNTTSTTSILGTTGVGSTTLPANFFTSGRTLHIIVSGYHSVTLTPTLTITVKLGAVVIGTAVVLENPTGDVGCSLDFTMTCRTSGTSGLIIGEGYWVEDAQPTAMVNVSPVAINTTTTQVLDVTATWSAASSSNVINGKIGVVDVKN